VLTEITTVSTSFIYCFLLTVAPHEQEQDVAVEVEPPGNIISTPFMPFVGN
jgi:hypothetical protein